MIYVILILCFLIVKVIIILNNVVFEGEGELVYVGGYAILLEVDYIFKVFFG